MKQYLNIKRTGSNSSFKRDLDLVSRRVEALVFICLSIFCIVVSRVEYGYSKKISGFFIDISLPIVEFAASPFNVAINLITDFKELVEAKTENEILRDDLNRLQSFYVESLNIRQENIQLRNLLKFVRSRSSSFEIARIIGASNRVFSQQVFIDVGENNGIKEGSVVTGGQGVIGRISAVYKNKSSLILTTDSNSRIPVITSKSRVRGVLAGNGGGLMEILYLPKDHKIQKGDRVFTSGDGDILPPGLLIGIIKKVGAGYAMVNMVESVDNVDVVTIINNDLN